MSTSTYYLFDLDGKPLETKELRNGHLSSPIIWSDLCERHFGSRVAWLMSPALEAAGTPGSLFTLRANGQLNADDELLLQITADRTMLPRALFIATFGVLRRFLANLGNAGHWPEILTWLHKNATNEAVLGFGYCATSCSEDLWRSENEETGETEYFDARQAFIVEGVPVTHEQEKLLTYEDAEVADFFLPFTIGTDSVKN